MTSQYKYLNYATDSMTRIGKHINALYDAEVVDPSGAFSIALNVPASGGQTDMVVSQATSTLLVTDTATFQGVHVTFPSSD
jgi:hypothetical protein